MATQDRLNLRLDNIKNSPSRKKYMNAPGDYRAFLPATLGITPEEVPMAYENLKGISQKGQNATNISRSQADNRADFYAKQRAEEELKRAQRMLKNAQKLPNIKVNPGRGLNKMDRVNFGKEAKRDARQNFGPYGKNYGGTRNFGKRWGKDNTPEVSDIKKLKPNGGLVTVEWRNKNFTVNRQVAPIFVAFLDDLHSAGYRPKVIGGYANRNIAGTNTKSLHSLGYAIDVDPTRNPVQDNDGSMHHDLPPRVKALAAKYGLTWGGSWNSYKDPMHFSVAYGGRE